MTRGMQRVKEELAYCLACGRSMDSLYTEFRGVSKDVTPLSKHSIDSKDSKRETSL